MVFGRGDTIVCLLVGFSNDIREKRGMLIGLNFLDLRRLLHLNFFPLQLVKKQNLRLLVPSYGLSRNEYIPFHLGKKKDKILLEFFFFFS